MKGLERIKNKGRVLRRGMGTRPFRVFDPTSKIQDL